ncbi:MAG: penicillin-binding protein 2 [Candidatus Aminicenantes bacterium]|nr:penicillin-binding protein 2 [Candidatus Aminicenantes bacterium]
MFGEKIYEDLSLLQKRALLVRTIIAAAFVALIFFYWKIQVLDHGSFLARAEANRTREIIVPAPRGILTDRSGKIILADNRASFKASLIRENTKNLEASILAAARLLSLEPAVIRERIERYAAEPAFRPIVVKDELSQEEVAMLEARKAQLPELIIETEPKRTYPFGEFAAHSLGYLQELTPEELRTVYKDRRRPGDMVGKTGIEAGYENDLTGREGQIVEVVDSLGRKQSEAMNVAPEAASGLHLALDYDLQAKAQDLLRGKEGAVVVLSAKTGDVLALASFPTYDPNKFINRFTPEEWTGLVGSPDRPLLNRAIQGLYSPGSTFKIVMASAGLESGSIVPSTQFVCGGEIEIYGNSFSCMGVHGALTMTDAIRYSCNIYFYNLGRRLGIDTIAAYAQRMGLGRKTGIDIPGEKEGLVPTPEWKKLTRKTAWFPGETISVAIGQGPLQVTPLQMAAVTALIANRGRSVRPRLVIGEAAGTPTEVPGLTRDAMDAVVEGMWRSVNAQGTGQGARVEGFDVCGKTGSTQTISSEKADRISPQSRQRKTHSWFVGFAPRNDPQIVVAILIEFGGLGGATAAPVARELFNLYKAKYAGPNPPAGN